MKVERSRKNKMRSISKMKNTRNNSAYYIIVVIGLLAAIALYFSGFSVRKFFMIFVLEVLGVVLLGWLVIPKQDKRTKSNKHSQLQSKAPKAPIESDLRVTMPVGSKSRTRKLVKLDKANFNWSDEDILRQQKVPVESVEKEEENTFHYRSPFEPINPPAKAVQEQTEDKDSLLDEDTMDAENDIYTAIQQQDEADLESTAGLATYQEIYDRNALDDLQDAEENTISDIHSKHKLRAVAVKKRVSRMENTQKEIADDYEYPSVSMLNQNDVRMNQTNTEFEVKANAKKLVETLASFGVGVKLLNISQGPSVTRYELQPNTGVKVSKIVNLADDIALNLAAKDVRIEAPIPGKAAIGIEVPNQETVSVFLREVLESKEFKSHPSNVAFAVGKDITGNNVVADIAGMPHLLIAGATGSGKSVCINTLITSILYKAAPSEVRLLMIDPKVVELGIYNGVPHLLIPVVTDPKKAAGALQWAVQEMGRRYQLFADNNARDLKGYNALVKKREEGNTLPQVVIIIDELADLMMVAPSEVEDAICRLAQMARAAGMHLVIATQRPSVDVITGLIKANIPSRISFAVSSQIDSRTILDMGGAEKLLGKGDMLFNPMGESKPIRVQGAFISDSEVEAVVSFIKSNTLVSYDEDIIENINGRSEMAQSGAEDEDELLPQATEMAIDHGQASASLFQRKFKIGYSRAARLLDQMEARGLVSGYEGNKPRQMLITREEWEELLMSN